MNMWIEDYCPKCQARNFVSIGDQTDITGPDAPSGLRCWKCKNEWVFEDSAGYDVEDEEDAEIEDGVKNP